MANAEGVMKRASELKKQGMPNALAMKQAWAEKREAEKKAASNK